ncbi:MAG: hypothetical protein JO147_12430 [Actinobacteria bacterium]|nr:hypothetical protein [Actinomycetota bacterium]
MDPLLQRIDAQPRPGSYAVTFLMSDGQERSVVMRVEGDAVDVPAANLLDGWDPASESFRAALTAVAAAHRAREAAGTSRSLLLDVEGGWDVSIGNVVLGDNGRPTCVAHGEMGEPTPGRFECAECGAAATYGAA